MSEITPIPTVAYTSDDTVTLTDAEKNAMITDLGGALQSDLDTTNGLVTDAQTDATNALTDAANANTNANTRCLDSEAIKTTGNQTKIGRLTLSTFAEYTTIPANPSGNQIPRYTDVINAISAAVPNPSWTSLDLLNGWSGSAKYRVIGDYLEVYVNVSHTTIASLSIASIASSSARPDYDCSIFIQSAGTSVDSLSIGSDGDLSILTASSSGSFACHAKIIRLAP